MQLYEFVGGPRSRFVPRNVHGGVRSVVLQMLVSAKRGGGEPQADGALDDNETYAECDHRREMLEKTVTDLANLITESSVVGLNDGTNGETELNIAAYDRTSMTWLFGAASDEVMRTKQKLLALRGELDASPSLGSAAKRQAKRSVRAVDVSDPVTADLIADAIARGDLRTAKRAFALGSKVGRNKSGRRTRGGSQILAGDSLDEGRVNFSSDDPDSGQDANQLQPAPGLLPIRPATKSEELARQKRMLELSSQLEDSPADGPKKSRAAAAAEETARGGSALGHFLAGTSAWWKGGRDKRVMQRSPGMGLPSEIRLNKTPAKANSTRPVRGGGDSSFSKYKTQFAMLTADEQSQMLGNKRSFGQAGGGNDPHREYLFYGVDGDENESVNVLDENDYADLPRAEFLDVINDEQNAGRPQPAAPPFLPPARKLHFEDEEDSENASHFSFEDDRDSQDGLLELLQADEALDYEDKFNQFAWAEVDYHHTRRAPPPPPIARRVENEERDGLYSEGREAVFDDDERESLPMPEDEDSGELLRQCDAELEQRVNKYVFYQEGAHEAAPASDSDDDEQMSVHFSISPPRSRHHKLGLSSPSSSSDEGDDLHGFPPLRVPQRGYRSGHSSRTASANDGAASVVEKITCTGTGVEDLLHSCDSEGSSPDARYYYREKYGGSPGLSSRSSESEAEHRDANSSCNAGAAPEGGDSNTQEDGDEAALKNVEGHHETTKRSAGSSKMTEQGQDEREGARAALFSPSEEVPALFDDEDDDEDEDFEIDFSNHDQVPGAGTFTTGGSSSSSSRGAAGHSSSSVASAWSRLRDIGKQTSAPTCSAPSSSAASSSLFLSRGVFLFAPDGAPESGTVATKEPANDDKDDSGLDFTRPAEMALAKPKPAAAAPPKAGPGSAALAKPKPAAQPPKAGSGDAALAKPKPAAAPPKAGPPPGNAEASDGDDKGLDFTPREMALAKPKPAAAPPKAGPDNAALAKPKPPAAPPKAEPTTAPTNPGNVKAVDGAPETSVAKPKNEAMSASSVANPLNAGHRLAVKASAPSSSTATLIDASSRLSFEPVETEIAAVKAVAVPVPPAENRLSLETGFQFKAGDAGQVGRQPDSTQTIFTIAPKNDGATPVRTAPISKSEVPSSKILTEARLNAARQASREEERQLWVTKVDSVIANARKESAILAMERHSEVKQGSVIALRALEMETHAIWKKKLKELRAFADTLPKIDGSASGSFSGDPGGQIAAALREEDVLAEKEAERQKYTKQYVEKVENIVEVLHNARKHDQDLYQDKVQEMRAKMDEMAAELSKHAGAAVEHKKGRLETEGERDGLKTRLEEARAELRKSKAEKEELVKKMKEQAYAQAVGGGRETAASTAEQTAASATRRSARSRSPAAPSSGTSSGRPWEAAEDRRDHAEKSAKIKELTDANRLLKQRVREKDRKLRHLQDQTLPQLEESVTNLRGEMSRAQESADEDLESKSRELRAARDELRDKTEKLDQIAEAYEKEFLRQKTKYERETERLSEDRLRSEKELLLQIEMLEREVRHLRNWNDNLATGSGGSVSFVAGAARGPVTEDEDGSDKTGSRRTAPGGRQAGAPEHMRSSDFSKAYYAQRGKSGGKVNTKAAAEDLNVLQRKIDMLVAKMEGQKSPTTSYSPAERIASAALRRSRPDLLGTIRIPPEREVRLRQRAEEEPDSMTRMLGGSTFMAENENGQEKDEGRLHPGAAPRRARHRRDRLGRDREPRIRYHVVHRPGRPRTPRHARDRFRGVRGRVRLGPGVKIKK
eukprot:CAMPEP_0179006850 /NCGR_PEP_ID=MMETSP0795-20121207/14802_1 /TAXON_ID=88552 /ORGANISM="Amoebophrya sp., Strain Ameob2" /LENGTH=1777 /DNA_ID=CAMNT_0020701695 /DNA_START=30 /DNA_END=5364 /DNA_ORIENTATION=-